jgi:hypothetical protein
VRLGVFGRIKSRQDFLLSLGICAGGWNMENADAFPSKLLQASEFAWWHVNEYERMIREIEAKADDK